MLINPFIITHVFGEDAAKIRVYVDNARGWGWFFAGRGHFCGGYVGGYFIIIQLIGCIY